MKKEYSRPVLQTQPYVFDNICDLTTSPTPADDQYGEDAKSRNEFEDFQAAASHSDLQPLMFKTKWKVISMLFLLDAYRQSVGSTNHKPHSSEQIIKKYFILYNSRMDVFYDL